MTTAVIIAIRGHGEAGVVKAVESHGELVVARRCADLVEVLAAAAAGLGGVVVVSDQPGLDRSIVKTLTKQKVTIIGVPVGEEESKKYLALGIGTVTSVGAAPEEVVEAVVDSVREPLDVPDVPLIATPPGSGAIVAVWGPTGAPGRTTVAVNLASELAATMGSVVLVDADAYGGAVAPALGMLDEAPGIAAVARLALQGGDLGEGLRRHALAVRPGLSVLSGISRASRWAEVSAAALEPVLVALRSEAAVTVVDCGFGLEEGGTIALGPSRDEAALAVVREADLIVVVGSAEPLGIQRMVRALGDLADGPGGLTPKLVVVNRVRASVCGSNPAQAVGDILARYASVGETWIVPYDPKGCDAATLAGQTLSERAPRSAARRAIEALAKKVGEELNARVERSELAEARS